MLNCPVKPEEDRVIRVHTTVVARSDAETAVIDAGYKPRLRHPESLR
jgi:D-serine deaminase-like pyridoxal phosphate-dependent protein